MSEKTATERLREMLDERGVRWWPMRDVENGYYEDRDTEFLVCGCKHVAHEWGCRLQVDMLTPEQAIVATLGGGECECDGTIYWDNDLVSAYYEHELSCGHTVTTFDAEPPNFCEECGAKIRKAVGE